MYMQQINVAYPNLTENKSISNFSRKNPLLNISSSDDGSPCITAKQRVATEQFFTPLKVISVFMDSHSSSRMSVTRCWAKQWKKSRGDHFEAYLPSYVNVMPLCLPRCRAFFVRGWSSLVSLSSKNAIQTSRSLSKRSFSRTVLRR